VESNTDHEIIEAAEFQPLSGRTRGFRLKPSRTVFASALGLLACAPIIYFLFSAQSIKIDTTPPAEHWNIDGGVVLPVGNRYLLLAGTYTLEAEASGYYPLREAFQVTDEGRQEFVFQLDLLPDLLSVRSSPVDEANVSIDGEPVGRTPLGGIELPAGEHTLELAAPRYQVYREILRVAGGGNPLELAPVLIPAWSEVSVDSTPPGAVISVDDEERGYTPAVLELLQGRREIRLALQGYKSWQTLLEVPANDALALPPVELQVADGRLVISTRPGNANILIDGQFAGRSRLELNLEPGKSYQIEAFKAGYRNATKAVTIVSGQEQTMTLNLQADLGEVVIRAQPEDVTISINGRETELVNGIIQLPAVPQRISISKPGYVGWQTTVTPKPGFTQQIDVQLKTEEQAKWDAVKPQVTTSAGQTLKLIRPGRFTMGASRREAGRRANEGFREVELTRPYYLATREVTNAEFRQFKPDHSSGRSDRHSLNGDDQPVVSIRWEDAARYCNWLSQREGLNPSYRFSGDELVKFDDQATGYRLPTEAEWAWAARVTAEGLLKFPWGMQMPPSDKAGNFADRSAGTMQGRIISDYDDRFAVTAPVGSFTPTAAGLYDLGGNVAEWIHDYYGQVAKGSGKVETDPVGPEQGGFHVIRGSSWRHGTVVELRLSFRDYGDEARDDIGFRIARYVD
jgi:formylglycine-generating enzyme required for sulfatase activity